MIENNSKNIIETGRGNFLPRRVAFYGGSFDPLHNGHIAISNALLSQFDLDEFVFIPAFHAPHKIRMTPTSAYDRFAMLCLATEKMPASSVSKMEIEIPERPFTAYTLKRINAERPNDDIFFVMGADSWMDIKTWRDWETVLSLTNHIVVTRPGYKLSFSHVNDDIRERIIDLRGLDRKISETEITKPPHSIYLSDCVNLDISATKIRAKIRNDDVTWREDVPAEVANYIEKYQIYN
jgi:nicotinate-nucleotide adenylyltransferase